MVRMVDWRKACCIQMHRQRFQDRRLSAIMQLTAYAISPFRIQMSSNDIMHPTRHKEIGSTHRSFGGVMMSVKTSENLSRAADMVKQAIETGQSVL